MECIRKFRNKVSAHTAFQDPRSEDTKSLQMTSLILFSGMLYTYQDSHFSIGSNGGCIVNKEEEKSMKLPKVCIFNIQPNLKNHFKKYLPSLKLKCY